MRKSRFVIRIDHLTDDQMVFFGWAVEDENEEFKLYRRLHDGEQCVVQNETPRYMVVDDLNDAQQMTQGFIMDGPSGRREDK